MTCLHCVKKTEGRLHAKVLELGGTIARMPDADGQHIWWVAVYGYTATGPAPALLADLEAA